MAPGVVTDVSGEETIYMCTCGWGQGGLCGVWDWGGEGCALRATRDTTRPRPRPRPRTYVVSHEREAVISWLTAYRKT